MHAGSKRTNGSSHKGPPSKKRKINDDNPEDDEFEKFMKQINETASKQKKKALKKQKQIESKSVQESIQINSKKQQRIDFDAETPMDAFIEQMQSSDTMFLPTRKGTDGYNSDEEVYNIAKYVNKLNRDKQELKNQKKHKKGQHKESELKYDDYGNIITPDKDRIIADLQPLDHSKIYYQKFTKNFYVQHADIANMSPLQVKQVRDKYNIHITKNSHHNNVMAAVESFAYFGFDDKLMDVIISQSFSKPTPIQMQAVPLLLSGFDVMGLAKTGSGKTGAFIWPMISHIMGQDAIEAAHNDGAIALIISPTRELASQTYKECKRYVAPFGLRVCPLYGGLNMHQQRKLLRHGVEIIVATPGRFIDLLRDGSTNCRRITYVVVDEVDKMFSLGFESQIRSVIGQIRTDKQIAMFSATMNGKIEKIACDVMGDNYVAIRIGNVHLSNADITQYVEVVISDQYKFEWLKPRILTFVRNGLVIIFCRSKLKCEQLSRDLNNFNIPTGVLHGDLLQNNRQQILDKFAKSLISVLVATDVASRGLNIVNIMTVINYDCPHNIDSYIHRVGRTGRADNKNGVSYTLLTPKGGNDQLMASKLLELLRKLRMLVSPQLQQMVNGDFEAKKNGNNKKKYVDGKNSLMSTFVRATDSVINNGQTHVFDKEAPSNNQKRKRKNRWGN